MMKNIKRILDQIFIDIILKEQLLIFSRQLWNNFRNNFMNKNKNLEKLLKQKTQDVQFAIKISLQKIHLISILIQASIKRQKKILNKNLKK